MRNLTRSALKQVKLCITDENSHLGAHYERTHMTCQMSIGTAERANGWVEEETDIHDTEDTSASRNE
jgi:hypothetical protein